MAESTPVPEIPECEVERDGDGWKVTHESGASAHAPDERRARLAGLRLRVAAGLAADELMFRTGDPT